MELSTERDCEHIDASSLAAGLSLSCDHNELRRCTRAMLVGAGLFGALFFWQPNIPGTGYFIGLLSVLVTASLMSESIRRTPGNVLELNAYGIATRSGSRTCTIPWRVLDPQRPIRVHRGAISIPLKANEPWYWITAGGPGQRPLGFRLRHQLGTEAVLTWSFLLRPKVVANCIGRCYQLAEHDDGETVAAWTPPNRPAPHLPAHLLSRPLQWWRFRQTPTIAAGAFLLSANSSGQRRPCQIFAYGKRSTVPTPPVVRYALHEQGQELDKMGFEQQALCHLLLRMEGLEQFRLAYQHKHDTVVAVLLCELAHHDQGVEVTTLVQMISRSTERRWVITQNRPSISREDRGRIASEELVLPLWHRHVERMHNAPGVCQIPSLPAFFAAFAEYEELSISTLAKASILQAAPA